LRDWEIATDVPLVAMPLILIADSCWRGRGGWVFNSHNIFPFFISKLWGSYTPEHFC